MHVLFLSHNGISEPLGRSQVLAYAAGLVRRGHTFDLVTFEPPGAALPPVPRGIAHFPVERRPGHSLSEKLRDLWKALGITGRLARRPPDVIHARSLLPGLLAEFVRTRCPVPGLLLDYPGFLPREYLETGHWTRCDPRYVLAKAAEDVLLRRAEAVAVGTAHARAEVECRSGPEGPHVEIVPSCVDTTRFRPDPALRAETRRRLGFEGKFVLLYAGSLGSWYLDREILRFFSHLHRRSPEAHLLLLTHSPSREFATEAARLGLSRSLSTLAISHDDMARHLNAADAAVCFVAPLPSKRAASPVKLAEYLACGLPVVANAGFGDVEEHARRCPAILLLEDLSDRRIEEASAEILARAGREDIRREARSYALQAFDLERVALPAFERAYRAAVSRRNSSRSNGRPRGSA